MRLLYKILLVLVAAFLLPVAVLGITGYLAIRGVGDRAGQQVRSSLIEVERGRLLEYAQLKALEIEHFCSTYDAEVEHLRRGFFRIHETRDSYRPAIVAEDYRERDTAGLPAFGYVHPLFGAFTDFDNRIPGVPWLPPQGVKKVRSSPEFLREVTSSLEEVVLLSPALEEAWESLRGTLDLAWIVLVNGVTNVYPEYDYYEVIRDGPEVLDLDESGEDYVRLLNPENNPQRKLRWLEPYLDRFKGVWMTSAVVPLYEGNRFLGTVGLDILLGVLVEKVLAAKPGSRGYAVLLTASGRPLAMPEEGVGDLLVDPAQARAFRETLLPPHKQRWDADMEAALGGTSLDKHPDPAVRRLLGWMKDGSAGVVEVELRGTKRFVAFAPVRNAGWSLAVLVPEVEVLARAVAVESTLAGGTERTLRDYLLLAGCVVVICVVVGLLLNYVAARPLVLLTRRVERLNWSNLDFPVANGGRSDEIGQLTSRFAEAVGLIRDARDEVTQKGAALEDSNRLLSEVNVDLQREIGEKVKAQHALYEEKELLAVTLRSIGDGVIATDREGLVVSMNPVAEALTGMPLSRAEGRSLDEVFRIIDEGTRAPQLSPVKRVMEKGGAVELTNHTLLLGHDGVERAIADSGAPIRAGTGEIIGVVLVFRDVTERRHLEEELFRAQKLESVRLLAAGIAHDFNNLLAAILGNLSLAQARMPTDPKGGSERLVEAEKATIRARDLTLQLLTFSTGGAPIRSAMSLAGVLTETAGFALRGSAVRCEFTLPEDLWPVNADEGQVGQVVHNLVLNARQAMPSGGVIRLTARNEVVPEGCVSKLAPGRYVCVEVADSGVGIERDHMARIFDPFFTTRPGGTGLGLAVCFSIITRHEGRIEVDSSLGVGSTFRFWLPAADGESVPASAESAEPQRGSGRVLLMDDEDMIRDMGREMLESLGYSVVLARDGNDAVNAYAHALTSGQRFDLVILDLTVAGGMGGTEALQRVRRLDPAALAIVSSGYSMDPVMANHGTHGFDAAIPKPYNLLTMARVVASVLARGRR